MNLRHRKAAPTATSPGSSILLEVNHRDTPRTRTCQGATRSAGTRASPEIHSGSCNGLEGLEKLKTDCAHCVIPLDLMIPLMDGWQFRAKQLSEPELAQLPVIVLLATTEIRHDAAEIAPTRKYEERPPTNQALTPPRSPSKRKASCENERSYSVYSERMRATSARSPEPWEKHGHRCSAGSSATGSATASEAEQERRDGPLLPSSLLL